MGDVLDLEVIDDPVVASSLLDPLRRRVLDVLAQPGSATTVAGELGVPRQKVNYHLRALEDRGLVTLIEERPRRGLTERVVQASAKSYLLSPDVLGDVAPAPERTSRWSAAYLLACTARAIREVAALDRAATDAGAALPTLTIDTDICFPDPASRRAFTEGLAAAVAGLAADHHADVPGGRWHRLLITSHPRPTELTQ